MPRDRNSLVIVDYGAGNLRSIQKALEKVRIERGSGLRVIVSSDADEVASAAAVVLPGVGAAAHTMERLHECGLVEPLRAAAVSGRPFLGVCLGLQLLFASHEEGDVEGLGVLPGRARRFDEGLKVPHMGWNRLHFEPHPMFEGIGQDSYFYYVHSYYGQPYNPGSVVGTTSYGVQFCGALATGNMWAVQFHPEKSGANGLRLLGNFVANVEASTSWN